MLPIWPVRALGPRPVPDRLCLQSILFVLCKDIAWQLLPSESRFGRVRPAGAVWSGGSRPGSSTDCTGFCSPGLNAAGELDWSRARGRLPHPSEKRGCRRRSVAGRPAQDGKQAPLELRRRGILPVIARRGEINIHGLGKLCYVVEQTFALLHQFKRFAVRWERRTELHNALISLACSLICCRRSRRSDHDPFTNST